jgi:hypothetical protein
MNVPQTPRAAVGFSSPMHNDKISASMLTPFEIGKKIR